MFKDIMIEDLLNFHDKENLVLIDVRSPSEYEDMTIPGSLNIPLFNDEERAEVGTLYKQVSVDAAKERGLEIVSAKLPNFIKQFKEIDGEKVIFCWRGGMRSKTSATVLELMGIQSFRLHGGVKAYRQWVMEHLEALKISPKAYILNGCTGIGKTTILRRLKEKGHSTLDIEGIANHRGSIFGQIGLKPNNQKMFESLLVQEIIQLQSSPYILFEAESKRIGKIIIPDFVMEKKEQGTHLFIELPFEERVRHILEEYRPWNFHEDCLNAFKKIKKHIHTPIAHEIESSILSYNYETAIELLLEYYYDPKYVYTTRAYPEHQRINITAKNIDEAVHTIEQILISQSSTLRS
ncbi:tRNA 2-selenouridine(34) synthase MnmH [Cytobacillus sp. FJAT-54145]|uniref:tRNA 2-selenouridine(34) synthase MnmH n=1 Tax=Cytobacillus spartinae TaxID=3299023 RepID=A0ABW6K5D7_9BACI